MNKVYPNEYALIGDKFCYYYKGEKQSEGYINYVPQTGLVNKFDMALIRLRKIGVDVSKPMNVHIVNNLIIENIPNFYIAMGIYDEIIENTILQEEKSTLTKEEVKNIIKTIEFSKTQNGMNFEQLEELKSINNFAKFSCAKENKNYEAIYHANEKRPIIFSAIDDFIYEKLKTNYTANQLTK
ncbi:MAG: hypothetical protein PHQ62_00125 [Clostridia bacterium]|nr:hypothetical protein [Clostridia bacterium]